MDSSASHKHSRARDEEERSGGVAYDHRALEGTVECRQLDSLCSALSAYGAFKATIPHSMFITHVQVRVGIHGCRKSTILM